MRSQDKLYDVGINWMCLAFSVMQKAFSSTEIYFDYRNTVTDKDIVFIINRAHERGIKVCLKPVINCLDGMWRAHIQFPDSDMMGNDLYWDRWFEFYSAFLCHYAEIAEDTDCEMLCIGCEMSGTEHMEQHWRVLIKKIRTIYSGPLVYNTNHGREEEVKWFDALDYIGTSAYFRVGKVPGDSKENMLAAWNKVGQDMKRLSERLGKEIIFMEIGCRSAKECAMMPWDFTHNELERSEEEQANFYDSCLTAFHDQEWFAGAFWWDWSVEVYDTIEEAKENKGFDIHRKKAEQILKDWYTKL
ncbi:MAG TPA: glycosyl hydrolase family 53 [Lachnospiraceae bacterium]|nr:glycosyl hydrolase family 53 [Lachnospiraceae bacterium]HBY72225.1 glycosyl hydrolase family 53 [Lachnospiraceae bacterium]HCA69794.1 glycosyl hydrolase family 53 [Lachnospiraceae bacterium]HCM12177.1 glycosyl hydrolase family 53 [Lachnospiraceae bacterium]